MTTDAKQVPPALSAEEWGKVLRPNAERGFPEDGETAEDIAQSLASRASYRCDMEDWPQTIALANTALPDDSPYKVRPRDIEMLLDVARILLRSGAAHVDEAEQVLHIAGKLAALLPSE